MRYAYGIFQDRMLVASVDAPTLHDALREIGHYGRIAPLLSRFRTGFNRLKRTITFQFPDFRTVSLPHDSIVIPVDHFGTWCQNQKTRNFLKLRVYFGCGGRI